MLQRHQLVKRSLGQKLKTLSKKKMIAKAPLFWPFDGEVGRDRGMGRQRENEEEERCRRESRGEEQERAANSGNLFTV